MPSENLLKRFVELDSPEWAVAVENKRQRAFNAAEKEGISRQEIEQRFAVYQQKKGVAFHDERLRQEVGDGQLLTWWQGEIMVGYAPVSAAPLLGNQNHGVFSAWDIWVQPGLNSLHLQQIVSDLLQLARDNGVSHVQIQCYDDLAATTLALGGTPVRHTFEFDLRE